MLHIKASTKPIAKASYFPNPWLVHVLDPSHHRSLAHHSLGRTLLLISTIHSHHVWGQHGQISPFRVMYILGSLQPHYCFPKSHGLFSFSLVLGIVNGYSWGYIPILPGFFDGSPNILGTLTGVPQMISSWTSGGKACGFFNGQLDDKMTFRPTNVGVSMGGIFMNKLRI